MKRLLLLGAITVATAGLAPSASAQTEQKNLLKNGDFEQGGDSNVTQWTGLWPRELTKVSPGFLHPSEGAYAGKRCAAIETSSLGGYSSFSQELPSPPKDITSAHLEGWVRMDAPTNGASPAQAWFILTFYGQDTSVRHAFQSRKISAPTDWILVQVDAVVPAGTTRWMVQCGISGIGRVFFDDLRLTASKEKGGILQVKLAKVESAYFVEAKSESSTPWILFSIPFPFENQIPVGLKLQSEPANKIEGASIISEKDNQLLKVNLKPLATGEKVRIQAETLVLLRENSNPKKGSSPLAPKKVSPEIQPFLKPAPGIDGENKEIKGIASKFSKKDLESFLNDAFSFLKENIKSGGGNQGAVETLQRKAGVTMGLVNLTASFLQSVGVPVRILPCLFSKGRQAEHYILEAYVGTQGWTRIDAAAKAFPIAEPGHVVLRITYPDSSRTASNIPLFWETSPELLGTIGADESGRWQGCETIGSYAMGKLNLDGIDAVARSAFSSIGEEKVNPSMIRILATKNSTDWIEGSLAKEIERFFHP